MRVLLFAAGLFVANIPVEAAVCKPAYTTTSHSLPVSIIESSAIFTSATTTETFALPSTETVSPESTDTTAAESTLAATASSEVLSTSVTQKLSSVTTEEVSTTQEASATEQPTTTEETSTTIASSVAPAATPGSIVGTGPVAGLTLKGDGTRFIPLSFASSGSTQTLIFTLVNGKLSTGTNNNYLCLKYEDTGVLGPLVLCPFDNFTNAPLTCQQASDGTLACTAPNGSCTASGTCRRPNSGTPFSQFYVDSSQNGFFGPASGDFAGYSALNLVLAK